MENILTNLVILMIYASLAVGVVLFFLSITPLQFGSPIFNKIDKWKFKLKINNPLPKNNLLHNRQFHFSVFSLHLSDTIGLVIICNIQLTWEKMFK